MKKMPLWKNLCAKNNCNVVLVVVVAAVAVAVVRLLRLLHVAAVKMFGARFVINQRAAGKTTRKLFWPVCFGQKQKPNEFSFKQASHVMKNRKRWKYKRELLIKDGA